MTAIFTIYEVEDQILDHLLHKNAAWLQDRPRTMLGILEHLYLPVAYHGTCDGSWVERISTALWDAGYTPLGDGQDATWYWAEGQDLDLHLEDCAPPTNVMFDHESVSSPLGW